MTMHISRIDSQIVLRSGDNVIDVLTPRLAVGLASSLAGTVAQSLPPEAVDLIAELEALGERLHDTLAAWHPELHPRGPGTWHPSPWAAGPHTWPPVPPEVTKRCDNTSVGMIVRDGAGRYLLHRRVRPPEGIAPCAGHIDEHGTPEDAARAELREEYGLTLTSLRRTLTGWHPGPCRRQHGPHGPGHDWTVFEAQVTGTVEAGADEAEDIRWYTRAELQQLAVHTVSVARGVPGARQRDGLEPVWVEWLAELGVVHLSPEDASAVARLARRSPYQEVS